MQRGVVSRAALTLVVALTVSLGGIGVANAVPIQSPSFEVSEPEFGAGSALETCSGQYCAQASIGDPTGGSASSGSYDAEFSEVDPEDDPVLEVIVEPGVTDLGDLSTTESATKTTIVKVRNYMSDGYTIHIMGKPPVYDDHSLKTYSKPTKSEPGKEMFGINLAANTDPEVGSDLQYKSPEMPGMGEVSEGYNQPNHFMYRDGDVIARSEGESSEVIYTISMVVNIANSTPAGHYQGEYAAVVFPSF